MDVDDDDGLFNECNKLTNLSVYVNNHFDVIGLIMTAHAYPARTRASISHQFHVFISIMLRSKGLIVTAVALPYSSSVQSEIH